MFEDALVESSGRLKSKSRYWMIVTFALNLILLAGMVLGPLLHPEALPKMALTAMLTAPPPPPPPAPAPVQVVKVTRAVAPLNAMTAPTQIPHRIDMDKEPAPPQVTAGVPGAGMSSGPGSAKGVMNSIGLASAPEIVVRAPDRPKPAGRINVSSGVAAGFLLNRTTPVYPAIAKAAHVSGAVLLHAIISKAGTIESLQVVSGPEMLRASALDAVRQWHYKPYLLNGEPTEVETSITVNFSFGG